MATNSVVVGRGRVSGVASLRSINSCGVGRISPNPSARSGKTLVPSQTGRANGDIVVVVVVVELVVVFGVTAAVVAVDGAGRSAGLAVDDVGVAVVTVDVGVESVEQALASTASEMRNRRFRLFTIRAYRRRRVGPGRIL